MADSIGRQAGYFRLPRMIAGETTSGWRYPLEVILEYLAGDDTIEDLLREFPDLEREDILACLEFSRPMLAAKSVHLALK